jgi:hypothetical protein
MLVVKTMATFATICVLWSLWTSESLSAWLSVWQAAGNLAVSDRRLIPAFAVGIVGFASVVLIAARKDAARSGGWRPSFQRLAAANIVTLLAVAVLGTPELYARWLPDRVAGKYVQVVSSVREVRLSGHDADMAERGYYEQLLNVQNFNSQLWQVYAGWPLNWSRLEDTGALRLTGDFAKQELVPLQTIHFRNATLTTNRWGMRDRDYSQHPSPEVRRIAFVGSSHVMGYGVNDDETFDALVELQLNRWAQSNTGQAIEVLNFAVDGYCPLQELLITDRRVLGFGPDVVAHFAHGGAEQRSAIHLAEMARTNVPIPYAPLRDIVDRAGILPGMSEVEALRRIKPFGDEIISWAYRHFAMRCQEEGALPVWIYLPTAGDKARPQIAELKKLAEEAGFVALSLQDCYRGHDPKSIWFGEWDHHPNAFGHGLVADELFRILTDNSHVRAACGMNGSVVTDG